MQVKVCIKCKKQFNANKRRKICSECTRHKLHKKDLHYKKIKKIKKYLVKKLNIDITVCSYKKCNWKKYKISCEVHHIIPFSQGGTNSLDNLTLLCPNHHTLYHHQKISRKDIKTIQEIVDLRGIEPRSY